MKPGPKPVNGKTMTPAERQARYRERQKIEVGPGLGQVSTAMYWYKNGHFSSEDAAHGAFQLAYQQGMDGMGQSVHDWMGITEEQFNAWTRDRSLPELPGKKPVRTKGALG